ncbi:MAG: hypothetical protein DWQ07_03015 [Chloroflexi bacterium]|nr:MAG: hypothetical protein DWQ07_03015 [Chloroflexota bacterium]MBL1193529.1 hypothetical protein [Chloroflexota bacterium]NOH10820.1 hypothetical protein [Chloroflexota bacterium]
MSNQSKDLQRAYMFAHNWAKARGAEHLTPEYLLLGMLLDAQGPAKELLKKSDIDIAELWNKVEEKLPSAKEASNEKLSEDNKLKELMRTAGKDRPLVSQLDLLLAFVQSGQGPGRLLAQHGLRSKQVKRDLDAFVAVEANQQPAKAKTGSLLSQELSISMRRLREVKPLRQIHPVFLGMLAIVIGSGVLLNLELIPDYLGVFLFGLFGWIISVSLHEYGHAIVAYMAGDDSIIEKGYLTLNPILYAHGLLSILLPIIFLLMGGIGLPGGAVYVNHQALRDYRYSSLVSLAGPAMTFVVALLCLIPIWFFYPGNFFFVDTTGIWPALGLLAFLNLIALAINLLPIPGIDGYGIIRVWLPETLQSILNPMRMFGFVILYAIIFLPGFSSIFWSTMGQLSILLGLDPNLFIEGLDLFQFWM